VARKTKNNPVDEPVKKVSSGIRKILDKGRNSALILFEEKDPGQVISQEFVISARRDESKTFNIRIAESRLDVYSSPHLLDLSKVNKLTPLRFLPETKSSFSDLPGGQLLEDWGMFEFWDLKQSEILKFFGGVGDNVALFFRNLSTRPDNSLKIKADPSKSSGQTAGNTISELSLVKLLKDFADFYYQIYLFFYKLAWLAYLQVMRLVGRDEVVFLPDKKPEKLTGAAALEKMIALDQAPTIAELLKPTAESEEKFKIIKSSLSRKEIKERYQQDNFLRRAPVVNIQPPARSWPKESIGWDIGNFTFSAKFLKPLAIFCGLLIALTSSIKVMSYIGDIYQAKGRVLGEAELALQNIDQAETGLKAFDLAAAKVKFEAAGRNFVSAKEQLNGIKSSITVLAEIAPAQNTFKSGTNIIDLGEHLANAANYLLSGIEQASDQSDLSLSSRVKNFSLEIAPALDELVLAQKNSENIGTSHLPGEYKDKFLKLKASLPLAVDSLRQLQESADFGVKVLGDNDLKRYLLIFQNDNELRATGGFMGSYALVDFKNGQIVKITLPSGGTYDTRHDFNELLAPPQPLQLINNRWEFQDSNWWPDYPTSAQNMKFFFEKAGGPTVDGVFAINSSFFGELLKITGPIALSEYGKTITADNFEIELQKSIELEAKEKNKPKKILTEMAPLVLEKLMAVSPDQIFTLAEIIDSGLDRKDVQLYLTAPELQSFVAKNNWSGELTQTDGDYLAVNCVNIDGGKTDSVIKQKIYHRTEITAEGRVLDKLLIERRHLGPTDEIFTDWVNNSYLRVYVPLGSKLVTAAGFDSFSSDKYKTIDEKLKYKPELEAENSAVIDQTSGTKIYTENGKTVFANWSILAPQESHDLLLVYELPFTVGFSSKPKNLFRMAANVFSPEILPYSFSFQKQSGRSQDDLIKEVAYPKDFNLKIAYPEIGNQEAGQLLFEAKTDTDKNFVLGFVK
jgi:hypothetical protein